MEPHIVNSAKIDWKPLTEEGVNTTGLYVKILRYDNINKRPPTFLLKFDAGASYPNHSHPGGEEVFVIEGEVRFGPNHLVKGDYIYTSPGDTHSVFSKTGCTMLFVVPEEVEILK